jgi:hypothetical protein
MASKGRTTKGHSRSPRVQLIILSELLRRIAVRSWQRSISRYVDQVFLAMTAAYCFFRATNTRVSTQCVRYLS